MSANVGDRQAGKTRLLSQPCATCITRPAGERIPLPNSRITQFIRDAVDSGTYVVCHSTLPEGGAPAGMQPAVCRGFADRYPDTAALRVIGAMWGFLEVPPPETEH